MNERGLDAELAFIHKERLRANEVAQVTLIGNVEDKTCIIIDDMTDTSGTLCKAATELKEKGAKDVYAFITHGIFSGPAAERVKDSVLKKIVTTDSMVPPNISDIEARMGGKLATCSVDLLVAEVIRRTYQNEATQDIYETAYYKN